jgi:hypothetical protein
LDVALDARIQSNTLQITPEVLSLIAGIDEFKGAWRALGTLAPERLSALRPHQQPARRCGHHFFRSASRVTSFSSIDSANSFFSLAFSVSSARRRLASGTLMPPNLLRHREYEASLKPCLRQLWRS